MVFKQKALAKLFMTTSCYSHDSFFLCAGTEVSLDLGLVHTVQSQHQEDPPNTKCPEGVALQRVGVQATKVESERAPLQEVVPKYVKAVLLADW